MKIYKLLSSSDYKHDCLRFWLEDDFEGYGFSLHDSGWFKFTVINNYSRMKIL